ncbi:MAG: hypothetical protein CV081_07190 [Nitrospira sp. LK265]|nr:hypothetical protein [Nitrospira sp.]NGZ60271.1 hypothetical protein [Nitrospira sp. LK265]
MNHRTNTNRWMIDGCAGLCLWIGLSAAWMAIPAWGAEGPSAARDGLAGGVRSGEMGFRGPEVAGLDNTPEGGTLPGGTVPGGTLRGGTLPGGTIPGGTVPGGMLSGGTFPNETVPGGTLPGGTVPGGTVPSKKLPGEDHPNL